jgi:PAS domain S-box-containing protein
MGDSLPRAFNAIASAELEELANALLSAFGEELNRDGVLLDNRAQAMLRESRARLMAVIENSPGVAVQFYDQQGRVQLWNRASEIMFGFRADEAMGKPLDQLIHTPDEFHSFLDTTAEILRTGKPIGPTEFPFRRRNGARGTCLSTVFSIPGEKGQTWFVCMDVDITARRLAEEVGQQQRQILEAIALGSPLREVLDQIVQLLEDQITDSRCSILLLDDSRQRLRVGAAAHFSADYNALVDGLVIGPQRGACGTAAFTGDTVICHDLTTDPLWEDFRIIPQQFQFRACWSQPILMAESPTARAQAERVLGTFAVYHYVPCSPGEEQLAALRQAAHLASIVLERDRAEKRLREQQRFIESITTASPLLLFVYDFEKQEVVYRNRSLARELGYAESEAEQLDNDRTLPLMHPEDRARLPSLRDRWKNVRDGEVLELDLRFRHANGEYHWFVVHDTVFRRHDDGTVLQIVGTMQDVDARRRFEERLQQSQKMEAVGRLAGGVAHDFNNLLTIINGHSELLLSETAVEPHVAGALQAIHDAGQRAAGLTRQLLAFSRQSVFEPRRIDVNDLLRESAVLIRNLMHDNLELAFQLTDQPAFVLADPSQIEQAVLNLCINARDAMPSGGKLLLTTAVVSDLADGFEPLAGEVHNCVEISVHDTGTGMDAAVVQRMFEPFFTTKAPGHGTGLGMVVVQGVVQRHRGKVHVSSTPGAGTTVRLRLPRVHPASAPVVRPAAEQSPRGNETILLVDDNEVVRNVARYALEAHGYHVRQAASTDEAWAIANGPGAPIALLVTDVVMPGRSGHDLARQLQAIRPELPVLYISGYAEDELLQRSIEVADGSFLQKPFSPLALTRRVRQLLDRAPVVSRGASSH